MDIISQGVIFHEVDNSAKNAKIAHTRKFPRLQYINVDMNYYKGIFIRRQFVKIVMSMHLITRTKCEVVHITRYTSSCAYDYGCNTATIRRGTGKYG